MIWFLQDTRSYKSVESPQSRSCNTFGLENVEYKTRSRAQVISMIHEGLVQYNLCTIDINQAFSTGLVDVIFCSAH